MERVHPFLSSVVVIQCNRQIRPIRLCTFVDSTTITAGVIITTTFTVTVTVTTTTIIDFNRRSILSVVISQNHQVRSR